MRIRVVKVVVVFPVLGCRLLFVPRMIGLFCFASGVSC